MNKKQEQSLWWELGHKFWEYGDELENFADRLFVLTSKQQDRYTLGQVIFELVIYEQLWAMKVGLA